MIKKQHLPYIIQRLSMTTERWNAASVLGSFPSGEALKDTFLFVKLIVLCLHFIRKTTLFHETTTTLQRSHSHCSRNINPSRLQQTIHKRICASPTLPHFDPATVVCGGGGGGNQCYNYFWLPQALGLGTLTRLIDRINSNCSVQFTFKLSPLPVPPPEGHVPV